MASQSVKRKNVTKTIRVSICVRLFMVQVQKNHQQHQIFFFSLVHLMMRTVRVNSQMETICAHQIFCHFHFAQFFAINLV